MKRRAKAVSEREKLYDAEREGVRWSVDWLKDSGHPQAATALWSAWVRKKMDEAATRESRKRTK